MAGTKQVCETSCFRKEASEEVEDHLVCPGALAPHRTAQSELKVAVQDFCHPLPGEQTCSWLNLLDLLVALRTGLEANGFFLLLLDRSSLPHHPIGHIALGGPIGTWGWSAANLLLHSLMENLLLPRLTPIIRHLSTSASCWSHLSAHGKAESA